MSNRNRTFGAAIVLLASLLFTSRSARASEWSDSQRDVPADSAAARQVKWVIEVNADSGSQVVEIRERVPRNMMVYNFRVDVMFAGGDDASMEIPQWKATLRLGREGSAPVQRFANDSPAWRMISLYGVKLAADDQVILTVELSKAETRKVVIRLAIDHEQRDRQGSRTAIQPFLADAGTRDNSPNAIYEWKSDVNGYLVGISDLWRPSSADARLIDVTTGETVWSDSAHGRASFAASSSGVQSLFVKLVAGRVYQLIVSARADAPAQGGQRGATIMVAPNSSIN